MNFTEIIPDVSVPCLAAAMRLADLMGRSELAKNIIIAAELIVLFVIPALILLFYEQIFLIRFMASLMYGKWKLDNILRRLRRARKKASTGAPVRSDAPMRSDAAGADIENVSDAGVVDAGDISRIRDFVAVAVGKCAPRDDGKPRVRLSAVRFIDFRPRGLFTAGIGDLADAAETEDPSGVGDYAGTEELSDGENSSEEEEGLIGADGFHGADGDEWLRCEVGTTRYGSAAELLAAFREFTGGLPLVSYDAESGWERLRSAGCGDVVSGRCSIDLHRLCLLFDRKLPEDKLFISCYENGVFFSDSSGDAYALSCGLLFKHYAGKGSLRASVKDTLKSDDGQ